MPDPEEVAAMLAAQESRQRRMIRNEMRLIELLRIRIGLENQLAALPVRRPATSESARGTGQQRRTA